MRRVVVCLLLAAGCVEPERDPDRASRPIVNGTLDTGDPAVVALMDDFGDFCTGTLVHPRVVVTAAHCVDPSFGTPVDEIEVFFGTDVDEGGTVVRVVDGTTHPMWNGGTLANDIAVLRLAQPAPVDAMPMNTTPLDESFIGMTTRIVGFGVTSGNSFQSGEKRQATSTVTAYTASDMTYGGTPGQTCYGDSGGPNFLTVDGTEVLAGVTSWGDESCTEFGVNTRVDAYIVDFIQPYIDATDALPACIEDGFCDDTCMPRDPDCPPPCGDDGVCETMCETPETVDPDCPKNLPVGSDCVDANDCASALCIEAVDDRRIDYCSTTCSDDAGCPDDMECRATTEGGVSVCVFYPQTPGSLGWACTSDDECRFGGCITHEGASFCTQNCSTLACPVGYECADLAERSCVPIGDDDGCRVAPASRSDRGAAGPGLGFMLAGLAVLILRSRRR